MHPSSMAFRLLVAVTAIAAVGWGISRWSGGGRAIAVTGEPSRGGDSCLPVPAVSEASAAIGRGETPEMAQGGAPPIGSDSPNRPIGGNPALPAGRNNLD